MNYCQFHPRSSATFHCHDCEKSRCDKCVDTSHGMSNAICHLCGEALESLGTGGNFKPFWRRLPDAFRYPIHSDALFIIFAAALIPVFVMAFLPIWGSIITLFFIGALLKYCFTCLMRTAMGNFIPPHAREAYDGSFSILFKLLLLVSVLACAVVLGYKFLGVLAGGLISALVLVLIPAMLIRFARSESVVDALNPVVAFQIMVTIGLPYGLLLAFILIMMSSVGVLNSVVFYLMPKAAWPIQSIIGNYYAIVLFHLIGNMLFQFQRELGYSARDDEQDEIKTNPIEQVLNTATVLLKAGEYERVVQTFENSLKIYPNEQRIWEAYMDFLVATKKTELITNVADRILDVFSRQRSQDKLVHQFRRIRIVSPSYIPGNAAVRLTLAILLREQGDLKTPMQLLNGLHKTHPEFKKLISAYELLAEILEEQPMYRQQADKCRALVEQLQAKAERTAQEQEAIRESIEQSIKPVVKPSKGGALQPRVTAPTGSWELVPIEKAVEQ